MTVQDSANNIGATMSNTRLSVPKYNPLPAVKKNCTTVKLTERQLTNLSHLKTGIGSPSLSSTVLLCLHQMYNDAKYNHIAPEEYSPSAEPTPCAFNFVVSPEDRQIMKELKSFFGMRTNSQLIGFIIDEYFKGLEDIPFDIDVLDNDAVYLDGKDGE